MVMLRTMGGLRLKEATDECAGNERNMRRIRSGISRVFVNKRTRDHGRWVLRLKTAAGSGVCLRRGQDEGWEHFFIGQSE